ncbi:hypothetical protein CcI49_10835 [Frankia sp. CcI49]|nr:hypothetical protein CcI49_10835 [Frankia sp. CcI49]
MAAPPPPNRPTPTAPRRRAWTARPGRHAAQALDGSLPAAISRRYPLADGIRACVEFLNEHTRGKVVVVVAEDGAG